jgi:hypothetical protein
MSAFKGDGFNAQLVALFIDGRAVGVGYIDRALGTFTLA